MEDLDETYLDAAKQACHFCMEGDAGEECREKFCYKID